MTGAFSGIAGHVRQLAVLGQAMEHDAVAPAWLFHGPAGIGKMTAARAFARALLCTEVASRPCGSCDSCRVFGGGAHPDLLVVEPETKTLKIEQVRKVQDFLSLRAALGGRKVCLFDSADAMSIESANAMLKTLEEPPPGTVLVLVTPNPGRLPPTIHSRCRSISFGGLGDSETEEVLRREGWSAEEAAAGARLAEGSPGAVLSLRGDEWKEADETAALLAGAVAGGGEGVFGVVEGLSVKREKASLVLRLLMNGVRREIRSRLAGADPAVQDPSLLPLSLEGLAGLLENLMMTGRMLEGNVNVKLAFGALCRRWAEGLAGGPVRAIQREW